MCNRYNHTTAVDAIRRIFQDLGNKVGKFEAGGIYPDRTAPIVSHEGNCNTPHGARRGMPSAGNFECATQPRVTGCACLGSIFAALPH